MKIFVNARFLTQPVSGVQRYAIECSRQIKKLHPDVTFVAPKNILHKNIAKELEVKVIGRNTGHLWEQLDLPAYLSNNRRPPLLSLANTAPVVYSNNYITIHDLAFYHHPEWNSKAFSAWYNILIPRLAFNCRHIFTVSQAMRKEIIDCYKIPPAKVSVTYNGISQHMLASGGQNNVPKEKIILSVGSFNRRKNHQNLVSAFLDSNIKNEYQLAIIGDKNKVFSESGLDEKALAGNNIKIYEGLTEDELTDMYQKAEIIVSLSLYEGFGIPLLEGSYYGCKVLCSDIPVYHELFDGYASFCDPLDIKSIVNALQALTMTNTTKDISPLLEKCNYVNSARTIIDKITS
jgi:glycosyltransferase involved in cell wall biosynthesis